MQKQTDKIVTKCAVSPPRLTLNLRIKPEDKILIDRAARAVGKSRTKFILEAARRAAEDTLADLCIINIHQDVYQQFVEQLDGPPRINDAFRKTMQSKSPWDN